MEEEERREWKTRIIQQIVDEQKKSPNSPKSQEIICRIIVLLYKPFIFEALGKNILGMLSQLLQVIEHRVFSKEDPQLQAIISELLQNIKGMEKCQQVQEQS